MRKNNKKGFTLAELLIVVAIIAVLVAIAIPIFTSQLEKSREATDASNIRAAYAEVASEALLSDKTAIYKSVALKQKQNGWQNTQNDFPDNLLDGLTGTAAYVPTDSNGFNATSATYAYVYYKPAAAGAAGGTFHITFGTAVDSAASEYTELKNKN